MSKRQVQLITSLSSTKNLKAIDLEHLDAEKILLIKRLTTLTEGFGRVKDIVRKSDSYEVKVSYYSDVFNQDYKKAIVKEFPRVQISMANGFDTFNLEWHTYDQCEISEAVDNDYKLTQASKPVTILTYALKIFAIFLIFYCAYYVLKAVKPSKYQL